MCLTSDMIGLCWVDFGDLKVLLKRFLQLSTSSSQKTRALYFIEENDSRGFRRYRSVYSRHLGGRPPH
jgi:hypothetical protein